MAAVRMDFEICSLIFLLLFLITSALRKQTGSLISGNAGMLTILTCTSEVLEIAAVQCFQKDSSFLRMLSCTALLICLCLLPTTFREFFVFRRQHETKRDPLLRMLNMIPAVLCIITILCSIFNRYVFYIDARGFHTGRFFFLIYLNYAVYAVLSFIHILYHKRHRRIPLLMAAVILCMGAMPAVLTAIFPDVPMFSLCMTGMVFLAFSSEEQSYLFTDIISGALNREAFLFSIQEAEERGQYKHVFAIGMDNFKLINEMYTVEGGNQLMRQLVSILQGEFSRRRIYRLGGDTFALIVPGDTEYNKTIDTLHKILSRPFQCNGHTVRLSACIGVVHTANHSSMELVSALEYALSQAKAVGKGEVFDAAADSANAIKRHKAIETAIMENIRQQRFEVHYQPIFDTRKKRFHSMEALARLNVPGYGYVSPEEFIRIAEKNGTILKIGLLVLEEVCRFIKETDLADKGIEYVEVNLSVVQCTNDSIYPSIRSVLQKYDIPPEMINLELTESAAAYSEKKLIRNLARMSLMNLSFSLDDYGSGYSNINYIVTLPFTIAKIDKYLVWAAAKSPTSRIILEHIISMFRDIHMKVVTEGIEDAEMAEMVTRMGADFLQGYYYSKPVPKELLLERLEDGYVERFL